MPENHFDRWVRFHFTARSNGSDTVPMDHDVVAGKDSASTVLALQNVAGRPSMSG